MKIKVLVVDDEKVYCETVGERLRARNLEVFTAFNGEEAQELVSREEIDVVLLDMVMPGGGGIETLKTVKRSRPLVEVIVITGQAAVDNAIQAMELGAFYYLTKPVDTNKLLATIATAVRRKAEHEARIRQAEIERLLLSSAESTLT